MGSRSHLSFRVTEYRNYVTNTVFQGLSFADTGAGVPDTMGAVGPNHYIELLNAAANAPEGIAVYNKSGTNANVARTNLSGFFSVHDPDGTDYPTGTMVDQRILYDASSQAWVACAIDTGSHQVILAVSTNASNPTNLSSGWTRYVIRVAQPGVDSDFDTLGLDGNGLYLSVLHRNSAGLPQTNAGHTVVAIKKPDIYLGTNISAFPTNNLDLTLWTLQPAVNFDSVQSNGYAWFVAKGPPNLTNYQGGAIVYRRLQCRGTNAAWADTSWFTVSTTTNYQDYYDLDGTNTTVVQTSGISAPQTNGTVPLYWVGSRLMNAVIRNGALWTCHAVGFSNTNGTYAGDSSGAAVTRSGMQWFKLQISPDGTTLALADHGRVFDPAATNAWWYYFPSLIVNCAGDMVAGFSGSSPTNYIGSFYVWRVASGATLGQPRLIQDGTVTFPGNHWGDYSATSLDPTDDWSFWTVQQYATLVQLPAGSANRWGTVVARLKPNP